MRSLDDIQEEYEFLEGDERYRLLIELGRELDPMPDALKTDATLVRGCSASVWVYPTVEADELSLEGHALTDVAAWLKTRFGAELILAEYDGENGPALMAMAPQEKVLVTARTEDEDELLLEWHGTEQQVEAGMAELGAAFDA